MGNTNSAFKDLPLASQLQCPLSVFGREYCFGLRSDLTITSKSALSDNFLVSSAILKLPLFAIESRALVAKCTISDGSGATIATIRELNGLRSLEVTTSAERKLHVAFGSSRAYVFLGEVADLTAPLIARVASSGGLHPEYTVELAAGVDAVAITALLVVVKMIADCDVTLLASSSVMAAVVGVCA
ncbi:hypothetical protein H9P43_009864 [Blastocladiella emersonii ATCC 22665]|nr:hypothetical protein H9P43_009864 [Blastocladiella emersonii ATCC 22665]